MALKELWRRRRGRWLTLDAYQESGGVARALEELADKTYRGLPSDAHRRVAHNVFLRLTTLGDGVADTRRRVDRAELDLQGIDPRIVDETLAALSHSDARLIIADDQTYEVTQEAVIQQWSELRRWLDDNRDRIRLHRQISDRARAWEEAIKAHVHPTANSPAFSDADDSTGILLRKGQLEDAETLAQVPGVQLTVREQAFLDASIRLREAEAQRIDEQRQQELRHARVLADEQAKVAEQQR